MKYRGLKKIPDRYEKIIVTPHEEESESKPPLWILWQHEKREDGYSDMPLIDSICTSEDYARYHVYSWLGDHGKINNQTQLAELTNDGWQLYVERIPANHRFGSSMSQIFEDATLKRISAAFKREGTPKYSAEELKYLHHFSRTEGD